MPEIGTERSVLENIEKYTRHLNAELEMAFGLGLRVSINTHAMASLRGGPERLTVQVWNLLLEVPRAEPFRITDMNPASKKDSLKQ